jgi:[ribosomal protein S5]-alanine N-acetyltransferase
MDLSSFQTERLALRRVHSSDETALFRIYGDPSTNLHDPDETYADISVAQAALARWDTHWLSHGFGQWTVSTQAQPTQVIGFGGLTYRAYGKDQKLNLGYRFSPNVWGHGYATELANAALKIAFEELHLQEVFALIRPANTASIRVVAKLGMEQIGVLPHETTQSTRLVFRKLSTD